MSRALAFLAALALAAACASTARAARPMRTAILGGGDLNAADEALVYQRIRASGATAVRLSLTWKSVAPTKRPAGFDPTNPADPAYRWDVIDRHVVLAARAGLDVIFDLAKAPTWAQGPRGEGPKKGDWYPSPTELGKFVTAAARRYSGSFNGLPRVRYWIAWNEPNLTAYLNPQLRGKTYFAPGWYRRMLNEVARAVHAVHRDNLAIAGATAPFTTFTASGKLASPGPLRFMRSLLCVSAGKKPKSTCKARSTFDVWSTHPYTSGGPRHHAIGPNDVSLGDLPEMKRVLDAAWRLHHISARARPQFWITEFSWDTKPPDPHPLTVPLRLHARWVAEALYVTWKLGVSLLTWTQLRDDPYPAFPGQGGLYFRGRTLEQDRPKLSLTAFRFPFVAYKLRGGRRALVWGRTPSGKPERVIVEQAVRRSWRPVATLTANRYGIFTSRVRLAAKARFAAGAARQRYRQTVLADAPVSYWRLGEKSGPVIRDERGTHPGRYVGGVKLGVKGALAGDANTAASFNGTNARATLGVVNSPRTVELWLKTSAGADVAAFSNRNAASHFIFLGVSAGTGLAFDTYPLVTEDFVNNGDWHHLVYTYDGTAARLYLDGLQASTDVFTRLEGGSAASLGYDAALKTFYKGSLDEVAIYNRALTSAEVKAHYLASGRGTGGAEARTLRARTAGGARSVPFSLTRFPDRRVNPFGTPG